MTISAGHVKLILGERDRMETELKNFQSSRSYPAYANFILLKIQKEGLTSARCI